MSRKQRNSDGRLHFENRLRKLQGCICPICGDELLKAERFWPKAGWNLDHVYPRSRYKRLGNRGNVVLTHTGCNSRKGDRDPTGCEILMLHAVNARLGHELLDVDARDWRDPAQAPSALAIALQAVAA